MRLLIFLMLLRNEIAVHAFSPDTTDFDAYGMRIAANDALFVQANNDGDTFLVQFAPFDYTMNSLQCSIEFDDNAHYVYSVGVGVKQNSSVNPYFYFSGEVVPSGWSDSDQSGHNGTFIGIWINQDHQTIQQYLATRQPLSCNYFVTEQLRFLQSYGHQEYFVMAVEPYGQYAIGLATSFAFIYKPFAFVTMTTVAGAAIWPNNSTFNPCAADASETFTIVAGFLQNSARSRVRATPTVYLIRNTNLAVLSSWSYTASNSSWQGRLTYSGVNTWDSKFTMSVKINSNDTTRVLVGMPFLNTVFLFVVSNNGTNLTLASSLDNGQYVGYGRGVTWLTNSQAAILVPTYSLDYSTLYSTKIYLYTSLNSTTLPSSASMVFPNSQQPLPSTINAKLIRLTSTPDAIAVLDTDGGAIIILPEPPGFYASTDITDSPIAAAMPVVSHGITCMPGTYKSDTGVYPCSLCLSGTANPGAMVVTACTNCSSSSFCPVGAVYEMNASVLTSLSQSYAYPRSPDLDVFEDILLLNMFTLGSTGHCLLVSPIFWVLILLFLVAILLVVMASLHWCVQPIRRDQWRNNIKNVFTRTDLVGEGELWLGGLASLAIILMTIMSYTFAVSYLNQYPAEKVGPSSFACDQTIRNAKYESSLQPLAVPLSSEEQLIFDLLNEQNFTLQIDFLNTAATCMSLTIVGVTESTTTSLSLASCSNINGTLSATVYLPQHDEKIVATLSNNQLIGGFRIGLSGPGQLNDTSELKDLHFLQAFYSLSGRTLAQQATVNMAITKVINETEPLSVGDSEYGGIWYPTFTYNINDIFITTESYVLLANLTSTKLTVAISETSYYIKNSQSPIAKQPEIIFRTLLFTILCLEISALAFLICKLLIIPIYHKIVASCTHRPHNAVSSVLSRKSSIQ